jgi:predicted metal-dependent HD superfamily phosphohydrolase
MYTPLLMMRWFELFPRASEGARFHSFVELRELYQQPGRYYHVFSHVGFMIIARQRFFPDAPDELDKAIYGHDVVYDARRKDNEERSAVGMAEIQRSLGDSERSITEVKRLIPLTQRHEPAIGDVAGVQLCDLDLLSLGLPAKDYQANTLRIRQEYAYATDAEWAAERTAFIDRFLQRQVIYVTEAIRAEFEAAARRNLEHERAQLA